MHTPSFYRIYGLPLFVQRFLVMLLIGRRKFDKKEKSSLATPDYMHIRHRIVNHWLIFYISCRFCITVAMTAQAEAMSNIGGYYYTFVDTPSDRLVCKICHLPGRDPHLTDCCGAIFCKSCLERAQQATTVSTACAHCRAESFGSMINKQAHREIKSLHIYCTNKEKGCEWQGELNDINNHLRNSDGCQFEEVKCSNECGKMIE